MLPYTHHALEIADFAHESNDSHSYPTQAQQQEGKDESTKL